ncbi:MAG TPA: CoA pyrophosphatase [Actinomycetota bacterium]|nr:CoA pyrophosphatase [Actinomycetota bacterium]
MAAVTIASALRGVLDPSAPEPEVVGGVPAGVMVPVVAGPRPHLVLTRRTDRVRHHKGEISFPGGVRHADDPDLLSTALRETEEELGIAGDAFDVLGGLPPVHTIVSGYVIVPFVGILRGRPEVRPSPVEIDAVLELPVSALDAAEREVLATDGDGATRGWFAYEVDGHVVWGATGRIVHSFLEALRRSGWSPPKEG